MATSEIYTLSLHDALPISHILVSELAQLEIHQKKTLELEVIEHQVDVEILIIGADALLPADKSESFAQLEQECLKIVDQPSFKVSFQVPFTGQVKEIQHVRVAQVVSGVLLRQWPRLDLGLLVHRRPILTADQPFVIQGANLPFQRPAAPVLAGCLGHVPLPGLGALDPEQNAVVRPTQFGTQCVSFWERLIEPTHIAKVGNVEAFSKLFG